ncbi:transmembrane protein 238-like [Brachionichthys hirsutus]|uniref:transmembrane protein 238-like n=1 Tax=Brachionichthys hirsutus TaxID=412623 RepID=UPI00360463F5
MDPIRFIGECAPFFFIAVACDVIGIVLLFVGIFAELRIDGRFYGDFLIYSGSLVVFISLFCWLVWYAGNVPVSRDRDRDDGVRRRSSMARLARKFSERLAQSLRGGANGSQVEPPPHKAGRVTWGRSTVYCNDGYDGSLDPPEEGKRDM